MAVAEKRANQTTNDGDEKRTDKEIRGNREKGARLFDSAKVDDGDDEKNADADPNGVRQKRGDSGNQRADPRGDSNSCGENVVGKQGGCGHQAGKRAEIVARDGIRASAARVGGNRLAVGKINDDQQGDDGGTDGDDVLNAQQAQWNEQAEGSFRAVSGGAEAVQAEYGDAL